MGAGNVLDRMRQPFGYRHNAGAAFDLQALRQWLDYYHLPEAILDKDIRTLSGGEKQRLAVILAVMLGRTTFLLDEPVSALDAASRRQFVKMFQEHPDWTAVFVSHDEALAELAEATVELAPARRTP